jgi:hypothetical protein
MLLRSTAALEGRLTTVDQRARANDEALYTGVAMAQDGLICNFKPSCHVPIGGVAGAVYEDADKPRRIFATPFP